MSFGAGLYVREMKSKRDVSFHKVCGSAVFGLFYQWKKTPCGRLFAGSKQLYGWRLIHKLSFCYFILGQEIIYRLFYRRLLCSNLQPPEGVETGGLRFSEWRGRILIETWIFGKRRIEICWWTVDRLLLF